jgi:molybdate transport system substrate-binding protein
LAWLAAPSDDPRAENQGVLVFAAASLKNALDGAIDAFTREAGVKVTPSYAASSALAKQIEQGAPAAMFISADLDWMDYLQERGLIEPMSRSNLLGNTLVLVTAKDSAIADVALAPGLDLAALLGDGRLAVGEVKSVPAGKYAKAALERLGAWNGVADRLAQAENVRAALALVSRGEAPLGIVYRTDAAADPGVRIVGTFPADSHPPIIYPIALTRNASEPAAAFLAFLRSAPAAKAAFTRRGFTVLGPPSS